MNDHQIVEALRNRTVNGLTGIYDAYAQPLYAYCWSLLGDEAAAQEALTDSFIVAEAHVDKLADPGRLRVWLYTIARNECQQRPAGSTAPDAAEPAARHVTAPAADAPEETATGPSVGIDDLLSGGSSSPRGTDQPAGSSMMMAPGVLGVPGGPTAPADDSSTDSSADSSAEPATDPADTTAIPSDDRGGTDAEPADTGQAGGPGDTGADDGKGSTAAERVLGGLPAVDHEVLELTYRHSLATADVATVIGLAAEQVQSAHAHADQQVRSGLAVERLATGGRLGPPELAARLDDGEPPPAALVLSVTPPTLPDGFQPAVIGNFTSAEKIGYRLHVGGRAGPFDKAGFPVPPAHAGPGGAARSAGGGSCARGWRWPAAGVGVAACLAGVLAAVILWPTGNTEHARSASAPGAQTTDFGAPGVPAAPSITMSATPTPSETPPATPTSSPSPPDGQRPGGTGNGGTGGGNGNGGGNGSGGGGGNGGGGGDDPPPPDPPTTGPPPTWSTTEPDPDPFP